MTLQTRKHFPALAFLASLGLALVACIDPASAASERNWSLGQFTSIELVPREPGASDNQHPAAWSAELLRRQLGAVRAVVDGKSEPLFHPDELDALAEPLSQALAGARPEDDVLLLSTHRRGGPFFVSPMGLTARLFAQNGNLQLIVRDARLDFYNRYLGSKVTPTFTFGSRDKPGGAVLLGATAANQRKDWVSISAVAPAAIGSPSPAPVPAPVPAAGPVAAPAAPTAAPVQPSAVGIPGPIAAPLTPPRDAARPATAPLAAATRVPRPRDAGFAEEVEQRLLTLKRLFDKGLITEAEYQQKRKEVLQLL